MKIEEIEQANKLLGEIINAENIIEYYDKAGKHNVRIMLDNFSTTNIIIGAELSRELNTIIFNYVEEYIKAKKQELEEL